MHHNELAEQAAIGLLLRNSYRAKETKLRPEHFYFTNGQIIMKAILNASETLENFDVVHVCRELTKHGDIERVGGVQAIVDLESGSYGEFEEYERIVIDCWKCRHARNLAKSFMFAIDDTKDPSEINSLIKHLEMTDEMGQDAEENGEERLQEWYEKTVNRVGMSGVTTGFSDLDSLLGGYEDENFYVIGARPAVGKTALALCSALKVCAKKGSIAAFFSLEMPMEQLLNRMACAIGGIDTYKLKEPKVRFTERDWEEFNKATRYLRILVAKKQLIIYDKAGMTIQEIRSKLRTLRRRHPEQKIVSFVDYLQLIRTTTKHRDRRLEVSEVSRMSKEIARQCKIPFVALAQLSRDVEYRNNKKPTKADLKESGDIEQDADTIMLLNPNEELPNVVDVIVDKNRHGATGVVQLLFTKQFSRYESYTPYRP